MAQVSHMGEWKPLPSDVADWMGSVEEGDLLARPADAAAPIELADERGLRDRIRRMLTIDRRAS